MRFYLLFAKKSVPEWKQCYYNYEQMKQVITLCKKAHAIRCNIEDLAKQDSYSLEENQILLQNKAAIEQIKAEKIKKITEMIEQCNFHFYKYHSLNKRVVFIFLQYKIHSISARLTLYDQWEDYVVESKYELNKLLSNCYAECLKLSVMTKLHIEAYEKIFKKHHKAFKNFDLTTPNLKTARLVRSLSAFQSLSHRLDQIVNDHREIIEKENRFKLIQQREPSPFRVSAMSYFFGLFNGFSVCVFIASIVLLAVNLGPENQLNQTRRIVFRNQYRLWKCTGLIALYMWVFAISIYIFEKKKINYPLIFQYEHVAKKSTRALASSTIVILIWCCFFVFYVMDQIGIYRVARVSTDPSYPITIFFPLILLGIYIISIIFQYLYARRGAILMLFMFIKILVTMFGSSDLAFNVIWATQQLVSLFEAFADFAYTICYYSRDLQTPDIIDNPCFNLRIIPQCLAIFVFSIRFIQCLRIAYEDKVFWCTRSMFRLIRASINIALASLSIAVKANRDVIPWIWLVIAILGSAYSFCIDVLIDWNLFNINFSRKLTRKEYHIFSQRIINFMIAYNVIARISFNITFSANLIYQFVPSPEILISIAGVIELGRRLAWNLLRVQNQQIKNNYFFQIRTDYHKKEKKVIEELQKKKQCEQTINNLDRLRSEKQLELLRNFIRQKVDMRQKIIQFCKKTDKSLDQIQDSAQEQIFRLMPSSNE